ncbi:hypothetical protein PQQ81_10965 [Paraburkholderia strydomiana]|uniref:hypothetical protein n=1 Tax=Paraburkholderia strydomiana TaxID=1245417 RepID=UPI0038B6CBB6
MPTFKVAHIREQGVDLIIIPLDSAFGRKMTSDQQDIIADMQVRAQAAGISGTVVPVWDAGGGRMGFIAPTNWHSFFKSLSLPLVAVNINKDLYW